MGFPRSRRQGSNSFLNDGRLRAQLRCNLADIVQLTEPPAESAPRPKTGQVAGKWNLGADQSIGRDNDLT